MLSEHTLDVAGRYWADHFGVRHEGFLAEPFEIVIHGGELTGYRGAFGLFRDRSALISLPPDRAAPLCEQLFLRVNDRSPHGLASVLAPLATAVIGPVFVGYAESVAQPVHAVRALETSDAPARDALRLVCDATEWEHGGTLVEHLCSGAFEGNALAAMAGYEVWGGTIAHISVVTHPGHRGRGFGRSVVAHIAQRAIAAGLLPQYRTLESNLPSMKIAESLGFQRYATTMAARLR